MAVSAVNLSNLNNLKSVLEANKNSSLEQQQKLVKSLFSQSYYNGGSQSKAQIAAEIQRLENYIKTLEAKMTVANQELKNLNSQVKSAQDELADELTKIANESETYTQEQLDATNDAVKRAQNLYKDGKISEGEIPSKIADFIAESNPAGAMRIRNMVSSSESKSSRIKLLVNQLTTAFDKAENISDQLSTANSSLSLMKILSSKIGETAGAYKNTNADTALPVYTPVKEGYVDQCVQQYRVDATGSDIYSYDNAQLQKLGEALGMDGGVSYLDTMKTMGFTYKEAVYASVFIFNQVGITYQPGGDLNVPYGHGDQAKAVYDEFLRQISINWGVNGSRYDENDGGSGDIDDGSNGNGNINGGTDVDGGNTNIDGNGNTNRTDPIGFKKGNVTYEFSVDRNNDNIFNGSEEFLGALNGIKELFALDSNGDGKVSVDEMDGLFVVRNDHSAGDFGFMSAADAGISEIDLGSFKEMNYTNVNNNILAGTFNLTLNGRSQMGYQTLDNEHYLNTAYGAGFGREYTLSLTDAETKDIFSKFKENSTVMSQEELNTVLAKANDGESNVKDTAKAVRANEQEVKEDKNEAIESELPAGMTQKEKDEEEKKKLSVEQ